MKGRRKRTDFVTKAIKNYEDKEAEKGGEKINYTDRPNV